MRRLCGAVAAVALATGIAAGGTSAGVKPGPAPFGMTIVRFAPGTTLAQMQAAVAAAGGEIVADLSPIGAVGVASGAQGPNVFTGKVKGQKGVRGAFGDRLVRDGQGPDAGGGASAGKAPKLDGRGTQSPPDPWHDLPSLFGGTGSADVVQWDDGRMSVQDAWKLTTGDHALRVAVIDSGVQGSHKELAANYDSQSSGNFIPCDKLTRVYGPGAASVLGDCSSQDTDGHGTWVASRIAGAANGFASNGVAPNVQVMGIKVLATGFGGFTSWILSGLLYSCTHGADIANLSIGGYDDPFRGSPEDRIANGDDYLLWGDAVKFCNDHGTVVVASAGNEHVRVNRTTVTIPTSQGPVTIAGAGQVDQGDQGIASVFPGDEPASPQYDLRGELPNPGGVPGVITVSATGNANGSTVDPKAVSWTSHLGAKDQLAYYSNYGSRIDLAAPGGARKLNVPLYDGGPDDVLYDGWGSFGALDPSGELCRGPAGSFQNFACFKVTGSGFAFLQGTSMASPNVAGAAALVLSAHPELRGRPAGLLARLASTARRGVVNWMGPNDPRNTAPAYDGTPCPKGYCHVDQAHPIASADAYGAGIVNAGAAVAR